MSKRKQALWAAIGSSRSLRSSGRRRRRERPHLQRRSRRRGSTSARTTTAAGRRPTTRAACTSRRARQEGRDDVQGERPGGAAGLAGDREPRPRRQQDHLRDLVRLQTRWPRRRRSIPTSSSRGDRAQAGRRTWPSTSARARTRSTSPAWPPARRRRRASIGYVVPFAIPEVIRHANAFALGAQATHPGAKVKLVWTNSWFDPAKEKKAAREPRTPRAPT